MPTHSGSKQGQPSGISSNQLAELNQKIHTAHAKALDNEKRIQELEKIVNDKSQWNQTVRGWIGSKVYIELLTGNSVVGVLRTLDRYTLLVEKDVSRSEAPRLVEVIIHKGAIATISLH